MRTIKRIKTPDYLIMEHRGNVIKAYIEARYILERTQADSFQTYSGVVTLKSYIIKEIRYNIRLVRLVDTNADTVLYNLDRLEKALEMVDDYTKNREKIHLKSGTRAKAIEHLERIVEYLKEYARSTTDGKIKEWFEEII